MLLVAGQTDIPSHVAMSLFGGPIPDEAMTGCGAGTKEGPETGGGGCP